MEKNMNYLSVYNAGNIVLFIQIQRGTFYLFLRQNISGKFNILNYSFYLKYK